MFNLFKAPSFRDDHLGELHWKAGNWRGTIHLVDERFPLAIPGSRSGPNPQALEMAHTAPSEYSRCRGLIAEAMFEHYAPYAESFAEGELDASLAPRIVHRSEHIWPFVSVVYLAIIQLQGELSIEIGYQVEWDEDHTLGARLQNGKLIELNGSVLPP